MTLKEIITMALENINEDTDALTYDEYRSGMVRAINEAYTDICARRFQPRKTAGVNVPDDGRILHSSMPEDYLQVCNLYSAKGMPLTFSPRGSHIRVYGYSGGAKLEYVYMPGQLSVDSDKPIIPAAAHYCLADYAAWRHLATGSSARQARGAVFYESYLRAAARISRQGFEQPAILGKFSRI